MTGEKRVLSAKGENKRSKRDSSSELHPDNSTTHVDALDTQPPENSGGLVIPLGALPPEISPEANYMEPEDPEECDVSLNESERKGIAHISNLE